jgi:hypothetical protein
MPIGEIIGWIGLGIGFAHQLIQVVKLFWVDKGKFKYPKEISKIKYYMLAAQFVCLLFPAIIGKIPLFFTINYAIQLTMVIITAVTLERRGVKW